MKEWNVIHKVKSLYDEGRGASERAIARELGISRSTVRKYLSMEVDDIQQQMDAIEREKSLDQHRNTIINLLRSYPRLSAVKVLRKLKDVEPELRVSDRSMRRFIAALKGSGVVSDKARNYEPVVDMLPGMQCQVDGGELRKVLINGVEKVVYFMVFVLSCSRLMYVSASLKPIDTSMFIRMHDAAFRFFGGMPQECVYDQTKLVVIHEQYRELELNERFAQFATSAGFRIRCCRGYDPESKGKVEAGVKYVKGNCLYGEVFSDFSSLQQTMDSWLREVANVRRHGTTGRQPVEHYEQVERQHMRTYLAPSLPETAPALVRRKVDKTGLISWQGNRYSVPMQLQRGEVYLREDEGQLLIHDISGERVATWPVHKGKGEILKNTNHYRDPGEQIQQLEQEITALLGETSAKLICQKIQLSEPKIYKDQLRGLRIELSRLGRIEDAILTRLMSWEKFSVKQLVEAVEAWRAAPDRLEQREAVVTNRSKALQHYKGVSRHDIH